MTTTNNHTADTSPLLRRSNDGRMLGGVAGGIATFFDVDVLYVRIGFVALSVLGGGGVVLYIAAWALIPEQGSNIGLAQKFVRRARRHSS